MVYRIYITDALKVISENTSLGVGNAMTMRYFDMINPSEETEEKSGEEIAFDLIKRAGIKIVGGDVYESV